MQGNLTLAPGRPSLGSRNFFKGIPEIIFQTHTSRSAIDLDRSFYIAISWEVRRVVSAWPCEQATGKAGC
jgi:hypothetical protein